MTEKLKPEVLKVLDEFARKHGYDNWKQWNSQGVENLEVELATLAYEQGRKCRKVETEAREDDQR